MVNIFAGIRNQSETNLNLLGIVNLFLAVFFRLNIERDEAGLTWSQLTLNYAVALLPGSP